MHHGSIERDKFCKPSSKQVSEIKICSLMINVKVKRKISVPRKKCSADGDSKGNFRLQYLRVCKNQRRKLAF